MQPSASPSLPQFVRLCHLRSLCSSPRGWKSPELTWMDTRNGTAGEGTHRGTQALPSMAAGLCQGKAECHREKAGSSWAERPPHIHTSVQPQFLKILYLHICFVSGFLFVCFFPQTSRCNSSTLRQASPMQMQFGNTQTVAPQLQGKAKSLAPGALPTSPQALQGQWPLTGTGCSHTCWASPPPPRRLSRCCIRRRISCAGAAAQCSSQFQGCCRPPGIPPRPPAVSSGRWHSPAAPGGSPAPAPHDTRALWDSNAQPRCPSVGLLPLGTHLPRTYLGHRGLRCIRCGTRRWVGPLGRGGSGHGHRASGDRGQAARQAGCRGHPGSPRGTGSCRRGRRGAGTAHAHTCGHPALSGTR